MCICMCTTFVSAHSTVRQSVSVLHTLKVAMPIGDDDGKGKAKRKGEGRGLWAVGGKLAFEDV